MSDDQCETCRYWVSLRGYEVAGRETDHFGECRRFPPTLHNGDEVGEWPLTETGDWCGECESASPENTNK